MVMETCIEIKQNGDSTEVLYIFLFLLYVSRPFESYTDRICSLPHRNLKKMALVFGAAITAGF